MVVPTDPTAVSIATEALRLVNEKSTQDSTELGIYSGARLERIKNLIWNITLRNGDTRLKILQQTSFLIGTKGERVIPVPTDFSEEMSMSMLDGTHTDTAQTSTAATVTLASDEDLTEADAVGNFYLGLTGVSEAQFRQINAYDTTTKIATVAEEWDSGARPTATDTYMIMDTQSPVTEFHPTDLDDLQKTVPTGKPTRFSKYADEIYFDKALDKTTYGIRLRYFANLNRIDLDSSLMTKVYREWQALLEQGLYWNKLREIEHTDHVAAKKEFDDMAQDMIAKQLPYGGEFEGFVIG